MPASCRAKLGTGVSSSVVKEFVYPEGVTVDYKRRWRMVVVLESDTYGVAWLRIFGPL